jgi:hypothetical protein
VNCESTSGRPRWRILRAPATVLARRRPPRCAFGRAARSHSWDAGWCGGRSPSAARMPVRRLFRPCRCSFAPASPVTGTSGRTPGSNERPLRVEPRRPFKEPGMTAFSSADLERIPSQRRLRAVSGHSRPRPGTGKFDPFRTFGPAYEIETPATRRLVTTRRGCAMIPRRCAAKKVQSIRWGGARGFSDPHRRVPKCRSNLCR